MTPKSLLRAESAAGTLDEMATGSVRAGDRRSASRSTAKRSSG